MPVDDRILDLMGEGFKSQGRHSVVKGLDGDKERAADSIAIEKDTGADSQRVYGDYDNFNRRRKGELAQQLVEDDRWLLDYVRAKPLASTVSKDDWANLSSFTEAGKWLATEMNPLWKGIKSMRQVYDYIYPGDNSYFMRGFVTGLTKDNPELAGEFLEGMSYHMPGVFQPSLLSGSKAIKDFAATISPEGYERATKDMWDIGGVGDAWAWGMETLGSGIASLIPTVVTGGAGAAAGFGVAGPPGALVGGIAGAGGGSYALGYAEVFKALKDEGVDPATAANYAAAAAVPIAALDVGSLASIIGKVGVGAAKKEITKNIAKRIAIEMAKGTGKEGITESLQEMIKDATVAYATDQQFGTNEQIKAWIESGVAGGLVGGVAGGAMTPRTPRAPNKDLQEVRKVADIAQRSLENAEHWIKTGQVPPYGTDPFMDRLIELDSQEKLGVIDAIMERGDKTETKELSPELWEQLTKIVFGKQTIEIRWDAVRALYGEKVPEADDGILGWVPDIVQQFNNSNLTGESIKIKLADWTAKVDPEINKLLHDDLAFPDGRTLNEIKEAPKLSDVGKVTEISETAVPGMAEELDKPYSLSKGKEGKYDILDEQGNKAAGITVVERENGNNLYVGWETGQIDAAGLRTLLKRLKEEYPDAETITGQRVPGVESLERGLQGSKISVGMPFRIKESTVDVVRRSGALEPLFDLPREGPRALRIIPGRMEVGIRPIRGKQGFTITDEIGQAVAQLEVTPRNGGKEVHIDWIGSVRDYTGMEKQDLQNVFGPKLVRSLATELKKHFPDVATISGERVSGARPFGGDVLIDISKLEEEQQKAPAGWDVVEPMPPETAQLVDLTQGWLLHGTTRQVMTQRNRQWTPEELALEQHINKLMKKIVGHGPRIVGAEDIRRGPEHHQLYGVFQLYGDRVPLIAWSLESVDPIGTARHEAIHFLRDYGYIDEKEWAILEKYAKDKDLIKKHRIDTRYANLEARGEGQLEEAIADEFKDWRRVGMPEHAMGKVFQKILDILEGIKRAYREFLGREPTVDDIFRKIETGEVAERGPGKQRFEGQFPIKAEEGGAQVDFEPKAAELPQAVEEAISEPIEPGVPTFAPGALMDKARYAKYMRQINLRNREDKEKEYEDASREARRKQTPEWKAQFNEMQTEVKKEIANRPDWKVSQFFRNGMFFGMESKVMPKIDPKYLTPEQRAAFPSRFLSKGGMDPDALAGSFSYTNGSDMINQQIKFEQTRGTLGPKEFFDEMVKQETNRRMELKHGKLSENILQEAMDHVIGNTQMDLLHEETMALAERAGQQMPISKEDLRANAATRFNGEIASNVTMRGYFREMYRAGKAAELAFLKGDYITAFQQKQAQVHLFALAEHAKKFEKTTKQFDAIIKQFNKRDIDVKYIPPEYTEWIHSILFQIKRPPKRLPEDLQAMIAVRDFHTLADFVHDKNNFPEGWLENEVEINPNLVVWDKLLEVDENGLPTWNKDFDSLTVGELRALNTSLQSLKKIGRMEGKYIREGDVQDTKDLIGRLDKQLARRGEKKQRPPGEKPGVFTIGHLGLLQPEALWDRLDEGNQRGIFSRYFGIPLSKAANLYSTYQRRFAKMLVEADNKYGLKSSELKQKVDNDVFYEPAFMEDGKIPTGGTRFIPMTRQHVRGAILNWFNQSNRERLAEGYNTTVEDIEAWLGKVSTKEDWLWAQEIGRIYQEIQKDSDEMTFRMSGTIIEKLPLESFTNQFGTFEGLYYPIIYDRTRDGGSKLTKERSPPTKALTYNGWERKRTGSAGPLDLSLGQLEDFISRRLKDNAFREPLAEVYKIWSNKSFRASLSKYYGQHYVQMLDTFYKDLAGQTGYTSSVMGAGLRATELIRQNTISVLVGWNPGTVMKHGASAFVQSWKEAGIFKTDFYKAGMDLLKSDPETMEKNWSWITNGGKIGDLDWEGSAEIQRRHQHWAETIGGAGDIKMGKRNLRESMQFYGSYPVAWSDILSSKILWKARYDRVMREESLNMPIEEAHMLAVDMADKAVRRTHGSTAITSRPEFMRSRNAFVNSLTSLYGFFNHVYNRFYKMSWQAKDLAQGTVRGEVSPKEFMKGATDLASDFTMYVALPSLIEGIVVEAFMTADWDDMGWGEIAGHSLVHTTSAAIPLVREVVHAILSGHDPTVGILGAAFKAPTDMFRQLNKEEIDMGKAIQAANTLGGILTGLSSAQLGRWQRFMYNYLQGEEDPTDAEEWYRAFRTGTSQYRRH